MGIIKKIIDRELVGGTTNEEVYPISSTKAIYDTNNNTLEYILKGLLSKIEEVSARHGYYICSTISSDPDKEITIPNFELSTNVRLLVKMGYSNIVNGVSFEVNNTGAYPLYYNEVPASKNNTWASNEVLDIYFNGNSYQAFSSKEDSSSTHGYWELVNDSNGISYIKTKYPVVSEQGVTAYGGNPLIPSIFDGLPLDNTTIRKNPTTGLIEVIGGGTVTPGDVSWNDITDKPSWIGSTKPSYSWSEITGEVPFYTKTEIEDKFVTVTTELTKYVTLTTSQTISGAKTFTSLLTTAAIKAEGDINTPNICTSDSVYINGIRLYKSPEGNLILDGNLLVTGGVTAYSTGEEGGGSSGGLDVDLLWEILAGTGTQQINKTHLTDALNGYATQSWVTSQNYLKSVSIATISDLNSSWDALLKAAPSVYVTRHPTISEVTNKQSLVIKLNSGTTEDTNMFTYNATAAKTINITPSGIGAALSSHNHSWADITSGKPTTLSGYGITDGVNEVSVTGSGNAVTSASVSGHTLTLTNGSTFLLSSQYTAADILSKLKTVDGNGSGLDADMLDGLDSTKFFRHIASYSRAGGLSSQYVKVVPKSTYQRSSFYITRYRDGLVGTFIFAPDLYKNTSRVLTQIGGNMNQFWVWYYDSSNKCYYLELDGNSNFAIIGYENNITTSVVDSPSGVSNRSKMLANNEDNVASATKLQTARQINGTNFDGTADITTAKWGTARTITLDSYLSGSVSLDGSANVTLNANVIGLTSQGRKTAISGTTVPSSGVRLYEVYNNGYPKAYGNLLSISSAGSTELLLAWESTQRIYVRSKSDILTEEWSAWKTVAFTDDNVESATKLQTPRTLWGRSFDGTANVSGELSSVTNIKMTDSLFIRGRSDTKGIYMLVGDNTDGSLQFCAHDNFTWKTNIVRFAYNGNVGIGTITPSCKLHVAGDIKNTGIIDFGNTDESIIKAAGSTIIRQNGTTSKALIVSAIGGIMYFRPNGDSNTTGEMTLDTNGQLTVKGNSLSTGGITAYSSDARAKKIVEELNLSLKQISESPTIRFKWNGWNIPDDGKTHIGGIAQYVQKLLPECILDADGVLNMDYATTAYIYSVQTARHLQTYETRTDRKIKKLEKRVRFLEKQLKKLGYEEVNTLAN